MNTLAIHYGAHDCREYFKDEELPEWSSNVDWNGYKPSIFNHTNIKDIYFKDIKFSDPEILYKTGIQSGFEIAYKDRSIAICLEWKNSIDVLLIEKRDRFNPFAGMEEHLSISMLTNASCGSSCMSGFVHEIVFDLTNPTDKPDFAGVTIIGGYTHLPEAFFNSLTFKEVYGYYSKGDTFYWRGKKYKVE